MKKIIFAFLIFSSAFQLQAQNKSLSWFTDLSEAKNYAAGNQANILMVFAGSDWCKPCIQFKQDILLSEDFSEYAAGEIAILYLDFPARKKNRLPAEQTEHNEALAEKYNRSGAFPKILLLDKDQNILSEPVFKGQHVDEFVQQLTQNLPVK